MCWFFSSAHNLFAVMGTHVYAHDIMFSGLQPGVAMLRSETFCIEL
jgi:hypothetical protein